MHTAVKNSRLLFVLVLAFSALTVSACGFNLAGDVTPPPGWHPTPVPPTPNTAALYPALPPDPAAGEAIYQQACQKCHGDKALGDGPEASKLGITPAALASPEELRKDSPAQRFAILTTGKMDEGMPTFANTLTERQRWDVLAYIYTLATPKETLQHGKSLYTARCITCHEADGKGKDLTNLKRLAQSSDGDLFQAIEGSQHQPEVFQGLSEDDRWALVAYIRTLSFAHNAQEAAATPTAAATAAATPAAASPTAEAGTPAAATATPQANTIMVTGKVTNGTAGGSVPPNLEVTLHGYDQMTEAYTAKAKIDVAGKFTFRNVPFAAQRLYFVTAEHAGVLYGSHSASPTPQQNSLDLPVTIYETTTDASKVQVERLHLFVSPQTDQTLQVVEIYIITNQGDKTVVAPQKDAPVLTFQLPPQAVHLQFQNGSFGERYVQTPHGFGDLLPLYPQRTTQEVFAYDLPFSGKSIKISHPVPLKVAAAVLMAPEGQLTLSGAGLTDNGIQSDSQGDTFHVYNMNALEAGEPLTFTVKRSGSGLAFGNNKTGLAIGLIALGAALIGIAVVLFKREAPRRTPMPASAATAAVPEAIADDPEALMDAILALDDLYNEGKIAEEAYQQRRAALKGRLQTLLETSED